MIFNKYTYFVLFVLLMHTFGEVLARRRKNGKSASRTCQPPEPVANAKLRREYEDREEFNVNDEIEYDCEIGYSIEGRSRSRKCERNGQWSDVKFQCIVITCPYVENPEHGRRQDVNNEAGESTQFSCDDGYNLSGHSKLLCRTDGKWSPPNPPTCEPILCPELPRIQNGQIFQDTSDGIRNNYESVAEYTCRSGYYINERKRSYRRVCQADGTWSGEEPICDKPKCEEITPFYGGMIVYFGKREIWSQAYFSCSEAFSMFPKTFEYSECTEELEWYPKPPVCYQKARVQKPANSSITRGKDILLHLESYHIYCYSRYEMYRNKEYLEKTKEQITNFNGTLRPEPPECVEERCDPASQLKAIVRYKNGSEVNSKISSQTEVSLSCHPGYDFYRDNQPMNKPLIRRCVRGEIQRAPRCEEARCLFSGYPVNSNTFHRTFNSGHSYLVSGTYVYPNDKVEVICTNYDDYELFVNSTNTYLEDFSSECRSGNLDKASKEFPVCLEKRCFFEPQPDVCFSTSDDRECRKNKFEVQSRSFVNIRCKNGYTLYRSDDGSSVKVNDGESSIMCKNGTFFKNFKCIPDSFTLEVKDVFSDIKEAFETTLDRFTCRFSIFGSYTCKDPCIVSEIPFGFVKSVLFNKKITVEAEHGTEITFQCNPGYELSNQMRSTCKYGKWDNDKFPKCDPKPCQLSFEDGTLYWMNSKMLSEDNVKRQTFKNGTTLQVVCEKGFEMKTLSSRNKKENIRQDSVCVLGEWTPKYKCDPGPCAVPSVRHAQIVPKSATLSEHMEKIMVECDRGYHFDSIKEKNKIIATCMYGNWSTIIPSECQPDPCPLTLKLGTLYWVNSKLLTEVNGERQTFENGTHLEIQCEQGYDMKRMASQRNVENIRKDSTCIRGKWSDEYSCDPGSCIVPTVLNARLLTRAEKSYEHSDEVKFKCDEGHHFNENDSGGRKRKFKATCKLGNWSESIPSRCKPDSCKLSLKDGSKYFINNHTDEIKEEAWIKHETIIRLECEESFDIVNENDRKVDDFKDPVKVTCFQGQWKNPHYCKQQCKTVNVTDGILVSNEKNITVDDRIPHGESIILKCDGFEDKDVKCDDGKWRGNVRCTDENSNTSVHVSPGPQTTEDVSGIKETTEDSHSPHDEESTEYIDNSTADSDHDQTIQTNTETKGCTLPSDNRYKFMVDYTVEYKRKVLRSGDTLIVMCRWFDYDDYIYYGDEKETEQNATCNGTVLSQIKIDCNYAQSETCNELQNGQVLKVFGQYNVSCNKGFSLNLISENSLCTCEDGVLKSVIGSQIPKCIPDNCDLPYRIDDRLSVTYRGGVSLSGGSTVRNGDTVFFNCSKVDVQKYEPLNRRFKCVNGQWIEDERDKSWTFGNNGTFPSCREARCKPKCLNGGLCHKDNECDCQHMTEGERCEKINCNDECTENGGECISPGNCKCPTGRYGPKCDIEGCKLPDLSAKPKRSKIIYKPGEMVSDFQCEYGYILSSQKEMTCKEDGTWSNTVQCEKAVLYLIRVKTVDKWNGAGTDANVYIYLHGDGGRTDRIYLNGGFESGNLDETRISARDVRPITGVYVGHDGKGLNSAWYLEFASIFVENMDEYYVFKRTLPLWVFESEDIYLPRKGCIYTYDSGNAWSVPWDSLKRKRDFYELVQDKQMTLRACKQMCTELSNFQCLSVQYYRKEERCFGFMGYPFSLSGNWENPVYKQKCKKV